MHNLKIPERSAWPRPTIGIYVLWRDDVCIYVGQSHNVARRLMDHETSGVVFDHYSCIEAAPSDLTALEAAYTVQLRPSMNIAADGSLRSAALRRQASGLSVVVAPSKPFDALAVDAQAVAIKALPPNVLRERTRHQKTVLYYRVGKGKRLRLPDFDAPNFWSAYAAAAAA